jgi:hypothetical protein
MQEEAAVTEQREITTHYDGFGLNEQIIIRPGPPGPGGAAHFYNFVYRCQDGTEEPIGYLQFQEGPRNVEGSTPGLTASAVLAALLDHLGAFQRGPLPSIETGHTITKLEEADGWLRRRTRKRATDGALGTMRQANF